MPLYTKIISFPYTKHIAAAFPYIAELSKNRKEIYTKKYTKRKIKNPVHEEMKRIIYLKFSTLRRGMDFAPKTPVLVIITVYSTRRSSDAHNFAEGVCDALEKALSVNDRYFHCYTIPMVDKERPRIEVEVYQ